MQKLPSQTEDFLSRQLEAFSHRAYAPFSGKATAAIILLDDGAWIPGVRVESASFSLAIPALLNAYTTLMTFSSGRIAAMLMNRPFRPEELLLADSITPAPLERTSEFALTDQTIPVPLPSPDPLSPFLDADKPRSPGDGILLARRIARQAYVPESDFPVGCILETDEGNLIPGVNVENADWSKILCAERNALGTALTYGYRNFKNIYLTCCKDPACSPCGACRQLLAELSPKATLWMDRGSDPEQSSTPEMLLPASFTGHVLFNHS